MQTHVFRPAIVLAATVTMLLFAAQRPAFALPAFARQTGQPCTSCHIGAFGPQLTPFGIAFKLGGYTMTGGSGLGAGVPLSVMAFGSFTNTASNQPSPPAAIPSDNNNFELDQISAFLAGRASDYAGGWIQVTYSGVDHAAFLDNTDLRLTSPFTIGNDELRAGLDFNNNPSVQDPYNTLYAWGYPFVFSAVSPLPSATPMLGLLAGNTLGLTNYYWWNQSIYAEFGGYKSMRQTWVNALGEAAPPGYIEGVAPYARVAWQKLFGSQFIEVGAVGFYTPFAEGNFGMPGTNYYYDYGIDGTWQYLGDGTHIFTLTGNLLQEQQQLDASYAAGVANRAWHELTQLRLVGTYYYKNEYGATIAYDNITGSRDPLLYAPAPVTGSRNGSPNTQGLTFELDWIPFGKAANTLWDIEKNLKLGVQYTNYFEFNGASSNYDGYGRNASGNNTLYAFVWLAW